MQDVFHLESPGGGGYGKAGNQPDVCPPLAKKAKTFAMKGSLMTLQDSA